MRKYKLEKRSPRVSDYFTVRGTISDGEMCVKFGRSAGLRHHMYSRGVGRSDLSFLLRSEGQRIEKCTIWKNLSVKNIAQY